MNRNSPQQIEFRRLLSKLVDGVADKEDTEKISGALVDNAELQEVFVQVMQREAALDELHSRNLLADTLDFNTAKSLLPGESIAAGGVLSGEDVSKQNRLEESQSESTLARLQERLRSLADSKLSWALAASVVVAIGIAFMWPRTHARIIAAEDVLWKGNQHYKVGDPLGSEWLNIESGTIQIAFGSSAAVKLEGPARFRATGSNYCKLEQGTALAHVPPAAKGFTMFTPDLRLIDLGTSFRVNCADSQSTSVQILEGTVEAKVNDSGENKTLLAGDVAMVTKEKPSELQLAEKKSIFPLTSNRIAFREKHAASLAMNGFKGSNRCYVFLERYDLELPHDLSVNLSESKSYTRFSDESGSLPAGKRVDCYLVHSAPYGKPHGVQGTITFSRDILGVISSSDKLNATNGLFGSPWSLKCEHPERGFESAPDKNSDRVEISPDRRTLTLRVRTESIDQLRVLVETAEDVR